MYKINVKEYRRDNQKGKIQRNRKHRKQSKNTIQDGQHHTQANTNNVNKGNNVALGWDCNRMFYCHKSMERCQIWSGNICFTTGHQRLLLSNGCYDELTASCLLAQETLNFYINVVFV